MNCAVSLDCVRYISMHFCLNICQLTELWIWDVIVNSWPLFRCAVLFMFAIRRDSWASNPSLSNACHAWRRVSKKRSVARPSCSVRHVGRTCIAVFYQGCVTRGIPILCAGTVQTDGSCRARSMLHITLTRGQQMDIAGRGHYDSPKYCGTFLNAIPRSEKEVLWINPLIVSVKFVKRFPH